MLFATGAGAQSRIAWVPAVVFGMAMNTLLATIYIPNFYESCRNCKSDSAKRKEMRIVRKMLPYRSKRLFEDYLKGELV